MNGASLHLALNHLPVLQPIVGAIILLAGVILRLKQTQIIGLILIVSGAIAAIPTYLTGRSAQAVVQNYPLVLSAAITEHAQAAWLALIAIEIVGVVALVILIMIWRGREMSRQSLMALIALAVVASLLIARTAHLGGMIRHEELQQGRF